MSRSAHQKLKIIHVMDYLLRFSDETHPVTVADIITHLRTFGLEAERKSIYADVEALREYGLDVISVQDGRVYGYYVGARQFELPELKLLVDSVQSSKFITRSKTTQLIKKIEALASRYEAQLLARHVYVQNRIKTMNESIYYNVDAIHSGILAGRKIRFHYFEYTVQKKKSLRRGGAYYVMSPYALTWDDENYYMVAYDSEAKAIKHFRVDKMQDIAVTDEPRDGKESYDALDMAVYSKKVFGMFTGEEAAVKLRFTRDLVGAVLDRLGQEVMLIPDGDEHFTVTTSVVVSPQFFAWLCGFGTKVQILSPESVRWEMARHVEEIAAQYGDAENAK